MPMRICQQSDEDGINGEIVEMLTHSATHPYAFCSGMREHFVFIKVRERRRTPTR